MFWRQTHIFVLRAAEVNIAFLHIANFSASHVSCVLASTFRGFESLFLGTFYPLQLILDRNKQSIEPNVSSLAALIGRFSGTQGLGQRSPTTDWQTDWQTDWLTDEIKTRTAVLLGSVKKNEIAVWKKRNSCLDFYHRRLGDNTKEHCKDTARHIIKPMQLNKKSEHAMDVRMTWDFLPLTIEYEKSDFRGPRKW